MPDAWTATHRLTWHPADGSRPLELDVRLVRDVFDKRVVWLAVTQEQAEHDRPAEWVYLPHREEWEWCGLPGYRGQIGTVECVRL